MMNWKQHKYYHESDANYRVSIAITEHRHFKFCAWSPGQPREFLGVRNKPDEAKELCEQHYQKKQGKRPYHDDKPRHMRKHNP